VVRAWFLPEVNDEVIVQVQRSLPVDPASFTVTDAVGRVFSPDTLGAGRRNLRLSGRGPLQMDVSSCIDLSQDAPIPSSRECPIHDWAAGLRSTIRFSGSNTMTRSLTLSMIVSRAIGTMFSIR